MIFFVNVLSTAVIVDKLLVLNVGVDQSRIEVVFQFGQKLAEGVEAYTVRTVNREVRFVAWFGCANNITKISECLSELLYVVIDCWLLVVICDEIVELRSCHFTEVFNVNP